MLKRFLFALLPALALTFCAPASDSTDTIPTPQTATDSLIVTVEPADSTIPAASDAVTVLSNEASPSVWPAGAARYVVFSGPANASVRVSQRGGLGMAAPSAFDSEGRLVVYAFVNGDAPRRMQSGVKGALVLEVEGEGTFEFPVDFTAPR